jgi:Flp pilus assembly protein TadG
MQFTLARVRQRGQSPRSRGQSLAEFAIVFPIFMVIVGAIIQFGIIFWGQNTLTQIARDAGRWAATQSACANGTGAGQADILGTAKSIATQSALIGTSSTWTYGSAPTDNVFAQWTGATCPPIDNTQVTWVTITLRHNVPVFFPLIPGNGSLSTSAQFRMEPHP